MRPAISGRTLATMTIHHGVPKVSKAELVAERAGYRLRDWCSFVSIARSTFYTLPPEKQPKSVSVGRRRIIVESPVAWLARVGK